MGISWQCNGFARAESTCTILQCMRLQSTLHTAPGKCAKSPGGNLCLKVPARLNPARNVIAAVHVCGVIDIIAKCDTSWLPGGSFYYVRADLTCCLACRWPLSAVRRVDEISFPLHASDDQCNAAMFVPYVENVSFACLCRPSHQG